VTQETPGDLFPADETGLDDGAALGLRERKKKETRHAIHLAALRLVSEQGLGNVSSDDIAVAAGVSPRTFFNYFPTKETALTGSIDLLAQRIGQFFESSAPHESAFGLCRRLARRMVQLSTRDEEGWRLRREVLRQNPELASSMLGQHRDAQATLRLALEVRLGDSTGTSWLPAMLASTTFGAVAATVNLAQTSEEALVMLDEILDALAPGLDR